MSTDEETTAAQSDEALKKAETVLEVEQDARVANAKAAATAEPKDAEKTEKHLNQNG